MGLLNFFSNLSDAYYPEDAAAQEDLKLKRAQNARLLGIEDSRAQLLGTPDSQGNSIMAQPMAPVMPQQMQQYQPFLDGAAGPAQGPQQSAGMSGAQLLGYGQQRQGLLNNAFPDQRVAQIQAKAFPAAPTIGKYGPGDTAVLQGNGADGQPFVKPLFNAPFAPVKPDGPASGQAKLNADYKAGLITKEELDKGLAKENYIAPPPLNPPVEIDDPSSPTGRRWASREQAMGAAGPPMTAPSQNANTLRDEFNKQTEPARIVASQYRNAIKGAAAASPAGDMGLIYSFMKALDPGSSVKEGEYAQGEKLTGSYGQFWQSYNKAIDGQKLLPEVRTDILNQVKNIYTSHIPTFNAAKTRYTDIAKNQRVNPADVITDLPNVDEPAAPSATGKIDTLPSDAKKANDAKGVYYTSAQYPGKKIRP